LSEAKPDLAVTLKAGRTTVSGAQGDIQLDDDELIEAVAQRLAPSDRFSENILVMLSTMP
jgi:hypothetical protein